MKDIEVVMMRFSFPGFVYEDVVCLTFICPSLCVDFSNRSSLLNWRHLLFFAFSLLLDLTPVNNLRLLATPDNTTVNLCE